MQEKRLTYLGAFRLTMTWTFQSDESSEIQRDIQRTLPIDSNELGIED